MREQSKSIVDLVTPLTQALEMTKSGINHKPEENNSIAGGDCKLCKATVDWNSLRY